MANHTLLKELQQKIDYQFKDENLLFTALTHSSYAKLYPVISCLRISLIWQKVR